MLRPYGAAHTYPCQGGAGVSYVVRVRVRVRVLTMWPLSPSTPGELPLHCAGWVKLAFAWYQVPLDMTILDCSAGRSNEVGSEARHVSRRTAILTACERMS